MLSMTLESWVYLLLACVIGFMIGHWIKSQKNKTEMNNKYVNGLKRRILAETPVQTKKAKKKIRRAMKKNGGS
jgi:uncharacterized membrane-anchored protein YhcB (DUF1043 family)